MKSVICKILICALNYVCTVHCGCAGMLPQNLCKIVTNARIGHCTTMKQAGYQKRKITNLNPSVQVILNFVLQGLILFGCKITFCVALSPMGLRETLTLNFVSPCWYLIFCQTFCQFSSTVKPKHWC